MKKKVRGSGILVVVLSAIAFLIYTTSTYAEVEHFSILQKKYETDIISYYEKDIDNISDVYNTLVKNDNIIDFNN